MYICTYTFGLYIHLTNTLSCLCLGHTLVSHPCLLTPLLSPPKHAVKLPYWSSPWYCQYSRDLAHHMYVSYVSSLIAHLPPLISPCFRSEAEPDVLYFLSLPYGP